MHENIRYAQSSGSLGLSAFVVGAAIGAAAALAMAPVTGPAARAYLKRRGGLIARDAAAAMAMTSAFVSSWQRMLAAFGPAFAEGKAAYLRANGSQMNAGH